MKDDLDRRWHELGQFIREQRNVGQLSLRKLSEMAGVSNPYLSQIERGLRRPSAEILQQIARALEISAETLYVRAGILDEPAGEVDVVAEVRRDPTITEEQKKTLVRIYESFRRENQAADETADVAGASADHPGIFPARDPRHTPRGSGNQSPRRAGADVSAVAVLSLRRPRNRGRATGRHERLRRSRSACAAGVDVRIYAPPDADARPRVRAAPSSHVTAGPSICRGAPSVVDEFVDGSADLATARDVLHANHRPRSRHA